MYNEICGRVEKREKNLYLYIAKEKKKKRNESLFIYYVLYFRNLSYLKLI